MLFHIDGMRIIITLIISPMAWDEANAESMARKA